jgi:hypothetical protein
VTADGCETSLTSLSNCGACSRTCDLANASESCSTGTCTLGSCSTGYGNCNGNPADGCETNMRLSTSCGTSCTGLTNCTTLPYVSSGSCNASGGCVIGGCASGRAECNDVVSDGCERNLNDNAGSCGSGYLGTISGDTTSGTGPLTATNYGENWYYFQLREDDSGLGFPYISARIFLDVPAGVDYDLYVHGGGSCSSCVISSSSGLQGVDETVYVSWDDSWGSDDDRYVYVEVRWYSGSTLDCGGWTLTINGNWADSTRDC